MIFKTTKQRAHVVSVPWKNSGLVGLDEGIYLDVQTAGFGPDCDKGIFNPGSVYE